MKLLNMIWKFVIMLDMRDSDLDTYGYCYEMLIS